MWTRITIVVSTILLTCCQSKGQTNSDEQIDKLINLAVMSDSLMDLTSSIKYYSEILDIDSTKLIALNNRGRAYVWLGELASGFADFDKAVRLYPHERTFYTRGLAYLSINSYDKATFDLDKSIELNPSFGEAYYALSLIKANQDSLELALQLCSMAEKITYLPDWSRLIRCTVYQRKGDFHSVVKELTAAIKLDPTNPANYNDRGLAQNQLEHFEAAISDFDYAIMLDSKMAFAYNNKAFALFKLKQFEEALQTVNMSLELNAKNAHAYKNRAEIFNALDSKDQACKDLIEAAKFCSESALTKELMQLTSKICTE